MKVHELAGANPDLAWRLWWCWVWGLWLAFGLLDGGKPALQGKDELIGSLTPGRVLYIKYEEYIKERITPCGPPHPQMVIGESWREVKADGLFSGIGVVRGPEGELLTYIEWAGNESESVDVATGQRVYYPVVMGSAKSLAGWIEGIWKLPMSIEEDGL